MSEPWYVPPKTEVEKITRSGILGPCFLPGDVTTKPVVSALRLQRDPALAQLLEILVKALLGGQFDKQYDGPKLRKAFNTFMEGVEVPLT